jgi:hypothetical protein
MKGGGKHPWDIRIGPWTVRLTWKRALGALALAPVLWVLVILLHYFIFVAPGVRAERRESAAQRAQWWQEHGDEVTAERTEAERARIERFYDASTEPLGEAHSRSEAFQMLATNRPGSLPPRLEPFAEPPATLPEEMTPEEFEARSKEPFALPMRRVQVAHTPPVRVSFEGQTLQVTDTGLRSQTPATEIWWYDNESILVAVPGRNVPEAQKGPTYGELLVFYRLGQDPVILGEGLWDGVLYCGANGRIQVPTDVWVRFSEEISLPIYIEGRIEDDWKLVLPSIMGRPIEGNWDFALPQLLSADQIGAYRVGNWGSGSRNNCERYVQRPVDPTHQGSWAADEEGHWGVEFFKEREARGEPLWALRRIDLQNQVILDERIPFEWGREELSLPRYYPLSKSFFWQPPGMGTARERAAWEAGSCRNMTFFHVEDASFEHFCVPYGDWVWYAGIFPTARGIWSVTRGPRNGNAGPSGLYHIREGQDAVLMLPGVIGTAVRSPDGCRIALRHAISVDARMADGMTIKIVDLCIGEGESGGGR